MYVMKDFPKSELVINTKFGKQNQEIKIYREQDRGYQNLTETIALISAIACWHQQRCEWLV